MATPPRVVWLKPADVKPADIKPAKGTPPAGLNTKGKIVPKTAPAPKGKPTSPTRPDVSKTHEYLDSVKTKDDIKSEWGRLNSELKSANEAGNRQRAMQIKDAQAGLADKANKAGLTPKDMPLGTVGMDIKTAEGIGAATASLEGALEKKAYTKAMAQMAAIVKAKKGGYSEGKAKGKRKPKRRCELVPYNELKCEKGQEAHHVVPDWMLRTGKRGGAERIPNMPSLAKGPAICLEGGRGKEHNTAHKHTDRPAQRVGKNGSTTGVAGTITLGQGKAISSRAIEKATGGKKGGGCSRKDIQKQLDEQFKAHNDALLRGVKDARKVTDSIKGAVNPTLPRGD
jgi:hypothetical protein